MRSVQWLLLSGIITCLVFIVPKYNCASATTVSKLTKADCFNHDLKHHVQLDNTYEMLYTTDNTNITVCVRAKTTGWVGFGFSPRGAMTGADIFIGYVDNQGRTHGKDLYGTHNGRPSVDTNPSDWNVLNGKEINGYTIIALRRKLDTCESTTNQDFIIGRGTTRIIWSYHTQDPSNGTNINTYTYHIKRGVRSLLLLDPPLVENTLEHLNTTDPIAFDVNFTMINYSIPTNKTHYACKVVKLPANIRNKKHHIIRWEPIVYKNRVNIIHHLVLFKCKANDNEATVNHQHECYNNRPPGLMVCEKDVFLVWAVGGTPYDFPKDVGQPFGGPGSEVFYKLEVHYDNVKHVDNMVDSSGFRVILTDTPRPIDAGVLQLGVRISNNHIMPPGFPSLLSRGYCFPGCINEFTEKDDYITIIGGLLHSHLAGRKIRARLFRDGKELPPILEDDYYDFDYQETRSLPVFREIYKNDTIVTECDYQTDDRKKVTLGGFPTDEEMCFVYLTYFPEKKISACTSDVIWEDSVVTDTKLFQNFTLYDWSNSATRDKFVTDQDSAKVTQFCYGVHEHKFNGTVLDQFPLATLNKDWKDPSQCPNNG